MMIEKRQKGEGEGEDQKRESKIKQLIGNVKTMIIAKIPKYSDLKEKSN